MSDFLPLSPVLKDRYDLSFDELPADLRERVESLFVIPWNRLSPERRQRYTERWDYEHDPATERERKAVDELFDEMEAVSANIDKWENVGTSTAMDLAIQEDRLQPLRKTKAELEARKKRMRGDYFGGHLEQKAPRQRGPYATVIRGYIEECQRYNKMSGSQYPSWLQFRDWAINTKSAEESALGVRIHKNAKWIDDEGYRKAISRLNKPR